MKRTICSIFFILFILSVSAQDKAIAKVHYVFKHVNDTTQRDKYLKDEVVTYLGQSGSYYTSYQSARLSEQINEQMSSSSFDGNLVIKGSGTAIKDSYLLNLADEKLDKVQRIGSAEFVVSEVFPIQDWQIEEETKEIGGYSCQRATASFKGRNYEAWFTSDIPMSYGPWKLKGLPGLILSVKDYKNEVSFEYAGFDRLDDKSNILIQIPERAIPSTNEELVKLEIAFKDNPSAFMKAQSGRSITIGSNGNSSSASASFKAGGSTSNSMDPSKIKSMNVQKDENYKPSSVTNNPIERTK